MFGMMIAVIVLGALTHIHGAFALLLVPCLGLLACYAYTYVYGDWKREGTVGRVYMRVRITSGVFFVTTRAKTRRIQWIELGVVDRDEKPPLLTFTFFCLTAQIGLTTDALTEWKEHYSRTTTEYRDGDGKRRELTPEESAAISGYFAQAGSYMNSAFAEVTKVFDKLKKDGKV